MDKIKVLVADEDAEESVLITQEIEGTGNYRAVAHAASTTEVLALYGKTTPDLVICTTSLPGCTFLRLLHLLPAKCPGSEVAIFPVLDESLADHVILLQACAGFCIVGYLNRPIKSNLTVEALSVSWQTWRKGCWDCGFRHPIYSPERDPPNQPDVVLDRSIGKVIVRGARRNLTPKEWAILNLLEENEGRIVSPQMLIRVCFGGSYGDPAANLRWYVRSLRKKIEPRPDRPQHIVNIRGLGYIFRSSLIPPHEHPPTDKA